MPHKPIVLLIRDGWGYRKEKELNATEFGENPYTKELMEKYPTTLLKAAGESVGLPDGYQGNSEVGHMTMGAGRIFFQSLPRINKDIANGGFFRNPALLGAIENCRKNNSTLHILGLLQVEGVHAHMDHCIALLQMCKRENFTNAVVHVISDGRDALPTGTINNVKTLEEKMKSIEIGRIATIGGRYYAMDRDKRWERTKKEYDCIVDGISDFTFEDPVKCFEECYSKNETDEFIVPRKAKWYDGMGKNDSLIFFNFRTDRTRQLTMAMIEERFEGWDRKPLDIYFAAMTEFYAPMDRRARIAYPNEPAVNLLGQVLAANGKRQLRISETEKYAHVTFFFNGQVEEPNFGEDRILIPSPKVASYDLKPEMSVYEVGDRIVKEIDRNIYDVIVVNYVNADMVGHTGVWESILKAIKAVDDNTKKVVDKTLEKDGVVMIYADHGCCEDKTEEFKTSHTTNLIPFILVSNDPKLSSAKLKPGKGLEDVAPTVLKLLDIPKPKEMTGESLI
jgi:2,3-bisphosphoglycerate-independent phosphoglycerate mutase